MYGEAFELILGRRTYDQWSTYWPTASANPMAERMNAATKHVATHRPESLTWGSAIGIGPDIVSSVRDLKAQPGPDLILAGSSTLTSSLLEHGLADELILLVDPVLLGRGKRLFAEGTPPRSFTLQSAEPLPSGVVINTFHPAGPLQNLK